jgi:hypothetical protein
VGAYLIRQQVRSRDKPSRWEGQAISAFLAHPLIHPELIAQRIARYANLVGRDNVIAGSDCGFGTWVGQAAVDPDVVWAKLAAMAEGARLATRQFWGG